jgi:hypothetical protein
MDRDSLALTRPTVFRLCVVALVAALLVPSAVSALTHEPIELQRGTIEEPANGTTVIAVQGFKGRGQNSSKKPARLVAVGPEGARLVLSTIAGSMITVASLVFSMTLVALTLASSQLGPRLITRFMRDRINQVVLGTFIATFLYALLVLQTVTEGEAQEGVEPDQILRSERGSGGRRAWRGGASRTCATGAPCGPW